MIYIKKDRGEGAQLRRFTAALMLFTITVFSSFSQDAAEIVARMDQVLFAAKDKQGKVAIITKDKKGEEKVREAMMYQKGNDRKLYRYTKPESQAGIATLSLPGDVMWLYMPAFGKPKKISILAKSQAFNNTDFSLEDMANVPYSERYSAMLTNSEGDAFLVTLVPGPSKSNYSKIEAHVSKEYGYPVRMDYFDIQGKKIKTSVHKYEKTGKYWNATEVEMTDLGKGHSTRIVLTEMKFDQGLTDDMFLVENLAPAGK